MWQLLLPALAQGGQGGPVVLVGAPWVPFGPALAAQGLPPERLLCVQADAPAARLWAAEQALREQLRTMKIGPAEAGPMVCPGR